MVTGRYREHSIPTGDGRPAEPPSGAAAHSAFEQISQVCERQRLGELIFTQYVFGSWLFDFCSERIFSSTLSLMSNR